MWGSPLGEGSLLGEESLLGEGSLLGWDVEVSIGGGVSIGMGWGVSIGGGELVIARTVSIPGTELEYVLSTCFTSKIVGSISNYTW